MNRQDMFSTQPLGSGAFAIVRDAGPGKGRTGNPTDGDESDFQACRSAWERARQLSAEAWQALPCVRDIESAPDFSAADALAGCVPLTVVAQEVERALDNGWGEKTALSCILLASIALERHNGGDDALQLAQSALDVAARLQQPDQNDMRVLYASLIAPRIEGLNFSCDMLISLNENGTLPQMAQLHLASSAFVAGLQLPRISRYLDTAWHFATNVPPPGLGLIQALLYPHARPTLAELSGGHAIRQPSTNDWLAQLKAAVYVGRHEDAVTASRHVVSSIGPLTSIADRLTYHLFSAIALGRSHAPDAVATLTVHCHALYRLACACHIDVGAIAEFASAAYDLHVGRVLVGLRGLERVCDTATGARQHWLAALASEEAAFAASKAGLEFAAVHYRLQALTQYKRWGALGKVEMLKCEWSSLIKSPVLEQYVEGEKLRRCTKAEEIGLSIAHEVSQPLASIALHTAAANKWLLHPQPNIERALASLALIDEAGRHAEEVVRSIQRLASQQPHGSDCVEIDRTVEESLRALQPVIRQHAVDIELALGLGNSVIHANRAELRQVVTNLLVNAIEALANIDRSLGPRRVRIASHSIRAGEIEILIEDNGPGVAEHDRERIFCSLFTTKPDNTGLGLSISLAIVQTYHGSIEFEPLEPAGARFRIRFPIGMPEFAARAAAA